MQFDGFDYTVAAKVTLTAADLLFFYEVASNHYDYRCKAMARPRPKADNGNGIYRETDGWIIDTMTWLVAHHEKGGFTLDVEELLALCSENPELSYETTLTWRAMDTLSKVMEMARYASEPNMGLVWELSKTFNKVQSEIRRLTPKQ